MLFYKDIKSIELRSLAELINYTQTCSFHSFFFALNAIISIMVKMRWMEISENEEINKLLSNCSPWHFHYHFFLTVFDWFPHTHTAEAKKYFNTCPKITLNQMTVHQSCVCPRVPFIIRILLIQFVCFQSKLSEIKMNARLNQNNLKYFLHQITFSSKLFFLKKTFLFTSFYSFCGKYQLSSSFIILPR